MNPNTTEAVKDMTEYIKELEDLLWATAKGFLTTEMFKSYCEIMDRIETRKSKEK